MYFQMKIFGIFFYLVSFKCYLLSCNDFCYKNDLNCNVSSRRFLLYDINFPEGFNLRRDVYIRFAVLAHEMKKSNNPILNNFHLVLPSWSHLIHWKSKNNPKHIPWNLYFDLESLQKFAPVIEMHDFFNEFHHKYSKVIIDEVYTLQHFKDMFETGNFEERMNITECQSLNEHTFFFYSNITSNSYYCLSFHGPVTKLKELFIESKVQSILIEHAEVALHSSFGSKLYWKARRSMRFNKHLKKVADEFREKYLKSADKKDMTVLPSDWLNEKPQRSAKGGPYVGIHLRRRDFLRNRPNEAPSIPVIAQQTENILKTFNLDTLFVATDGSEKEFDDLSFLLSKYKVYKYTPSDEIKLKYGDGGIAIIDQIICSHAKYFIGTHESTFSFRIQEEREILGFPSETTFNVFCKDIEKCPMPSVWKIVY